MIDKITPAIQAAETKEQQVEMVRVQLQIPPNGRPVILALPKDITDIEIIATMCQVAALGDQLRAQRPVSRIILPT